MGCPGFGAHDWKTACGHLVGYSDGMKARLFAFRFSGDGMVGAVVPKDWSRPIADPRIFRFVSFQEVKILVVT